MQKGAFISLVLQRLVPEFMRHSLVLWFVWVGYRRIFGEPVLMCGLRRKAVYRGKNDR